MIDYLVVYTFKTDNGFGWGNAKMEAKEPIRGIEDVQSMESIIERDKGYDKAIITNYIRFGEEK